MDHIREICLESVGFYRAWPILNTWVIFFLIIISPTSDFPWTPQKLPYSNRISGLSLSPSRCLIDVRIMVIWTHTAPAQQPTNNQFFTPYFHTNSQSAKFTLINHYYLNYKKLHTKSYKLIYVLLNCHHHYLKYDHEIYKSTIMLIINADMSWKTTSTTTTTTTTTTTLVELLITASDIHHVRLQGSEVEASLTLWTVFFHG